VSGLQLAVSSWQFAVGSGIGIAMREVWDGKYDYYSKYESCVIYFRTAGCVVIGLRANRKPVTANR